MKSSTRPKSLSIVIPVLDEQDAIGLTLQRCLDARQDILQLAGLDSIEIIVVNDGSTDRTVEIVQSFPDVTLIDLGTNRGYGAAIKIGFAQAAGDLLGFLDGDGTCDPRFFGNLCQEIIDNGADIAIGSRMHNKSKMPAVRRIGNYLFAQLMTLLSGCPIKDTASGMRVIRRELFPKLNLLPDGLHFTPAMTCRALFDQQITLREIEMAYHERQGLSKLSVFRDGIRFLLSIINIALMYRPLKLFGWTGIFFFLISLLYGIKPLYSFIVHQAIPSGMIYRLLTINTLILASLTLFSVGIVAERITASLNGNRRKYSWLDRFLLSAFSTKKLIIAGPVLVLLGIVINVGPIRDYLTTQQISYHWGYISTGALLVLAGMQLSALGVFERLLEITIISHYSPPSSQKQP